METKTEIVDILTQLSNVVGNLNEVRAFFDEHGWMLAGDGGLFAGAPGRLEHNHTFLALVDVMRAQLVHIRKQSAVILPEEMPPLRTATYPGTTITPESVKPGPVTCETPKFIDPAPVITETFTQQ